MSDPLQEPTRLLDDPDLDLGLRHDLELASTHAPVNYSVEAGLARFEQAIHGAATVPPGGSVSGLRVLGWFVGAVALIGGIGYLIAQDRAQPSHDPVAQAAQVASATTTVRTEEEPVAVPRSSGARELPAGPLAHESVAEVGLRAGAGDAGPATQAEGDSPALDAPVPPRSTSKSIKKPATDKLGIADLDSEAALVNAARKALSTDPGKALALMEKAEQDYSIGAMVQERRGYTILALVALGRTDEAQGLADAYLERWPNGPLSRRVRDSLGLD